MDTYASGYLEAAEYLSRVLARRHGPLTLDSCVYPLVFLWRHYLELRVKELLMTLSGLRDHSPPPLRGHDLGMLWSRLRPLIETYLPEADVRRADGIFREFAKVDPTSETFRYHEDTRGRRSAPDVTHINVVHFSSRLSELASALEGVSMAASVERQEVASIRAWERGLAE